MIGISIVGMLSEKLQRCALTCSDYLAALMMFLRIQCLYRQYKPVYYSVGFLFCVQTGIYGFLLTRGQGMVLVPSEKQT